MLPIIIGGGVLATMLLTRSRLSTLVRITEDAAGSAVQGAARGASKFKRGVKIEMAARQLASAQRRVAEEDARLAKMSRAQKVQHARDVQSIVRRASELRTKRK